MTDIILLNGNHCPVRVADSEVRDMCENIKKVMGTARKDPSYFIEFDKTTFLLAKDIIGYYARPVVETQRRRLLNFLRTL